ncbi:hypothetical protein EZV61_15430 [Corallincola luteus]|uniref:Uncharacterized protein n=1 Tax=Corallincola luteus TaxID=1775177 RepID=A0ABY2AKP1_9GAMM|nr:hypothetical protein [Corallincola luteus]TCI01969.1 hypothetical protein EZV61_15430 [Corallincola luteus]
MMQKNRMFTLVREAIEEVPGLEKWSLKQLVNPDDPESIKISPIKIAMAWHTFGEFQLGNLTLGVTQEHRIGQPPQHVGFSLQSGQINGNTILYSRNNGKMAFVVGEIGDESNGQMYELPSPPGASQAVLEWLEDLAENTCWGD